MSQANAIRNTNEQGDSGRGYMDAQKIALDLLKVNNEQRNSIISKMPSNLRSKVESILNELLLEQERVKEQMKEEYSNEDPIEIDMRPMPEQRPPRRDSMK